jgi:SAM-dependent methyltransferase
MAKVSREIAALIKAKGGIRLDIGCGINKQSGFVGMDIQELEGVDIVHDWNDIPYPLPDESVVTILARHVIEHVPPHDFGFIKFMNELWRIMKPEGQLAIVMPYATSPGMYQDPTHCNFCNEITWCYFDPIALNGALYQFYKPKPWKLVEEPKFHALGNMEVLLEKRREDRSYYE